jgi:hypothetical protein
VPKVVPASAIKTINRILTTLIHLNLLKSILKDNGYAHCMGVLSVSKFLLGFAQVSQPAKVRFIRKSNQLGLENAIRSEDVIIRNYDCQSEFF